MSSLTETSFTVAKGEDRTIDWTITDDGTAEGDPMDITGWTFSCKVKRNDADPDPEVCAGTCVITNAMGGVVRASFASADLDAMEGDYRYSLWRTNAGAKKMLEQGFFSVLDSTEDA